MALYKKGGFRSMNKMNGDFLSQLKEPLRSEMNRNVLGNNQATSKKMNKYLDMHYKEKNFNLEKIRRKQDDMYAMMLKVHREKKLLQRAMYKEQQEEIRKGLRKPKPDRLQVETLTNTDQDQPKEQKGGKVHISDAHMKHDIKSDDSKVEGENSREPAEKPKRQFEKKTKVLEVSRKAPLVPIVRERSNLAEEALKSSENDSDTGQSQIVTKKNTALPPLQEKELSVSEIAISSVSEAQNPLKVSRHTPPKQSEGLPQIHSHSRRVSKSCVAMPTISEKDSGAREIPTRHSDGSTPGKAPTKRYKQDDLDGVTILPAITKPFLPEDFESTEMHSDHGIAENTKPMPSLAERNRKRARAKLKRRNKVLNQESVNVYMKADDGCFIPALTPFRRKDFAPPSMKEKHMQQKMIRAQVEARVDQRLKLESFFERMAEEERERQRIRDVYVNQLKQEAEDARKRAKEDQEKLGFSASQMASLYSSGILPEGVDPNSFEAIQYCKYIRTYSPNSIEMAGRQQNKKSSWT